MNSVRESFEKLQVTYRKSERFVEGSSPLRFRFYNTASLILGVSDYPANEEDMNSVKLVEAFEETLKWIQLLVGQIYQPVQGGVFNPPQHGCPVYAE